MTKREKVEHRQKELSVELGATGRARTDWGVWGGQHQRLLAYPSHSRVCQPRTATAHASVHRTARRAQGRLRYQPTNALGDPQY
eukprot:1981368-Rhodomonas_salina.4